MGRAWETGARELGGARDRRGLERSCELPDAGRGGGSPPGPLGAARGGAGGGEAGAQGGGAVCRMAYPGHPGAGGGGYYPGGVSASCTSSRPGRDPTLGRGGSTRGGSATAAPRRPRPARRLAPGPRCPASDPRLLLTSIPSLHEWLAGPGRGQVLIIEAHPYDSWIRQIGCCLPPPSPPSLRATAILI